MEQQGEVTGRRRLGCKEHREICVHMETDGHPQVYSAGGKEEEVDLTGKDCYGCSRWEGAPCK